MILILLEYIHITSDTAKNAKKCRSLRCSHGCNGGRDGRRRAFRLRLLWCREGRRVALLLLTGKLLLGCSPGSEFGSSQLLQMKLLPLLNRKTFQNLNSEKNDLNLAYVNELLLLEL